LGWGEWHLPYVIEEHNLDFLDAGTTRNAIKVSVARCARVSYMTHDGRTPDIGEDLALAERLLGSVPLHASPAEHQAGAFALASDSLMNRLRGNFARGWAQYRKFLAGECQ
jgi:hypothetical protein